MTQSESQPNTPPAIQKSRVRYLIPIVLLFVVPVVGYFVYDLLKPLVNPCEALFRQTQNSLDAKIELLNIKSEVNIQPLRMQELTERAQIVASNLQYCCTTLRGGERQPEDFIQCKTATSEFEKGLDNIVEMKQAANDSASSPQADYSVVKQLEQQINQIVDQTKQVSVAFNQKIANLQQTSQFAVLEAKQHANLEISKQEAEPNDSLLMPNTMPLNTWIQGELSGSTDNDFYTILSPSVHRDFILIEVQNQSTTLAPQVNVYNGDKALLASPYNGTNGGNLRYQFLVSPAQTYYLQLLEYRRSQKGTYLISASAMNRYDMHEPNQTLLEATSLSTDDQVDANIMDGSDYDFYQFESQQSGTIVIQFDNLSSTLAPQLDLYNANKSALHLVYDGSNGANIALQYAVEKDTTYYLRVMEYRNSQSGQYRLTFDYLD